ncbi:stage V sporulation protein AA [Serpentinicella alkaliphila]|uniref:Stage V sporulation protein AA n=1 Tax=Serpentinicella alkaliphila TaxID=1734049 RepID=A0A4R2TLL7_9FIRM|nr:stage V sporulation protein AA [Serpentinicella alkaliphila]QUH26014.1 stage V sporulation protein AA [Serpentinicella alkaliphila]TCQ02125.1 stage V sporulation protein AA [Serpentinicella alkaliphila]
MQDYKEVYVQSKGKAIIAPKNRIQLKEIVDIYAKNNLKEEIENIVYIIEDLNMNNTYIISLITIVNLIKSKFQDTTIIVIGDSEVVLNFKDKHLQNHTKYVGLRVALISFILFIGAITAIINFHSDVNMSEAHKTIYKVVTGVESDTPYLLQIPYSIGIGVGMSVFFNHVFKKRINNEPSPLEVEMYLYQQNMDEYIKDNSKNNK